MFDIRFVKIRLPLILALVGWMVFSSTSSIKAQDLKQVFTLSDNFRSSFPAVLYKNAFEEDLNFTQKTCFRAINGEFQISGFSAIGVANQCQNNLNRLEAIQKYVDDFLEIGCGMNSDKSRYFTTNSTKVLCGGYLKQVFLVELEANRQLFSEFRDDLLIFAEKCRRRTGDANGC